MPGANGTAQPLADTAPPIPVTPQPAPGAGAPVPSPPGAALGSADPVLPFRDSEVLRSILDAAPMRVTYLDGRRRYRFANSEFYGFTGLSLLGWCSFALLWVLLSGRRRDH